ncbi:hypothetical protein NOR_02870 [Metarhizium rileyi]|uniref:Uncharacterized protein n=1 Tax=Metarhizium rileyi (strain RCEF 4871) TaxID=1649241 RepID=A0A167G3P2_METRR|nr:hypothetical protein NOR_02870 [Metarhizium rileyi RCEF 4871]TWU79076.1 hypothetical protein ED733_008653 [Metarhizium rileyi]
MDKGLLLTASTVESGVSIDPHSTFIGRLEPAFAFAVPSSTRCTQAVFSPSKAFIATKFGAFHGFNMSAKALADFWDAKSTRMLRRKLFYEFAVFILGSGNPIILLLFWPGWLLVAGAWFALWQFWR